MYCYKNVLTDLQEDATKLAKLALFLSAVKSQLKIINRKLIVDIIDSLY